MKKLAYLSIILVVFLARNALGFELKTHVFVANEVVEDLSDNKVEIPPFGQFSVDANLSNLIKSEKESYFLGALGPDVVPDFIGGQLTVHEGGEPGWSADEWLKYLSKKPESTSLASWEAFYRGYISHAAADVFGHTYVNLYSGDIFDLTDEDHLQVEARHKLVEVLISQHQPYEVDVNSWLGENKIHDSLISGLKEKFIDQKSVSDQYYLKSLTKYLSYMKKYKDEVDRLADPIEVFKRTVKSTIGAYGDRQDFYNELIGRYDDQLGSNSQKITAQLKILRDLNPVINFAVCEFLYPDIKQQQEAWLRGACKWRREVDQAILDKISAEDEVARLESAARDFYKDNPDLARWASDLGVGQISRSDAAEALVLVAAAIVFANEIDLRAVALDIAFTQYRTYIVKEGGERYIRANINVAKNIMLNKNYFEATKPLRDWLLCYGPVYTNEYGSVGPTLCEAAKQGKKLVDEIENVIIETIKDEGIINIYHQYQAIQADIRETANEYGKKIISKVLTDEQKQIIEWLTKPVTDDAINKLFSQSGGDANLLVIPDAAQRIKSDMTLDSNGKLTVSKFAPIHNAIQLTKLSLLDEGELKRLEALAWGGYSDTRNAYHAGKFNIMYSWLRSLDGNHQWMLVSPPLPRALDYSDSSRSEDRTYSVGDGFLLWENIQARNKVFEKVFVGPIAPGIEAATNFGYTDLLSSETKYRLCEQSPFPQDEESSKCLPIAAWLTPILGILY